MSLWCGSASAVLMGTHHTWQFPGTQPEIRQEYFRRLWSEIILIATRLASFDIAALAEIVLFHRLPHMSGCIDECSPPPVMVVRSAFGCQLELTIAWTWPGG